MEKRRWIYHLQKIIFSYNYIKRNDEMTNNVNVQMFQKINFQTCILIVDFDLLIQILLILYQIYLENKKLIIIIFNINAIISLNN